MDGNTKGKYGLSVSSGGIADHSCQFVQNMGRAAGIRALDGVIVIHIHHVSFEHGFQDLPEDL
jgi:hypothetical protein